MSSSKRLLLLRTCRFEVLEPRQVLSAVAVVDPFAQLLQPKIKVSPRAGAGMMPVGFTPAQIQKAYGFDKIVFPGGIPGDGRGMTIAIVDAFNNPTILEDLKTFNTQFSLPQFNVAGGPTFKIVNQFGKSGAFNLPTNDPGWAGEIALDVEWAHAVAPRANILLVEATTNATIDLLNAVDFARRQPGVVVVSNSYGGPEYLGENLVDAFYGQPAGHIGVSFTVSAGDAGTPAENPSTSPNVISVGGTNLKLNASNNWSSETVWSKDPRRPANGAGGGGLSEIMDANGVLHPLQGVPSYQQSLGLTSRATPDVAYNGDPQTGVAVFSTYALGGWQSIGGTSAGAPQWAGLIAIADQGRKLSGKNSLSNAQVALYSIPRSDYHDITKGNNGAQATVGYDLASGLGSPIANLVVRDLVAFNGSTFVRTTGGSGGVSTSVWFPFARTHLLGSRMVSAMDESSGNLSGIDAAFADTIVADSSRGNATRFSGKSDVTAIRTETVTRETFDQNVHLRLSAADTALEALARAHRRTDLAQSEGLFDEVIAQL